jgi:uncharacterized repeat protein (TIGR02543 family)
MKTVLSSRKHHYLKRVGIFLFVIALIAMMVGASCGTSGYDLTMAADPAAGGTATDETKGSPYSEGTIISIKAEAKTGYQFVSWTAPAGTFGYANAASTIFVMPGADITVTANFAAVYDLSMAANPAGGGTAIDVFNASPYAAGTVVSIQAVAATGYHFVNWTGDVDTIEDVEDAKTTITMDGDYYIIANFEEVQVGVKAGDWIKLEYTINGWPAGESYPEWYKLEFVSVEGTTVTELMTMHMSDGTEESDTTSGDLGEGGGELSGSVISANLTTGDSFYMAGYGDVTIEGKTTRTYVGANRTVVYTSFSQYGSQLTYYWDKLTGVIVEASATYAYITLIAKATETNMWGSYS